jgi:hypothetical protein
VRRLANAQFESEQYAGMLALPLNQARAQKYALQKSFWQLNRRDCWATAQALLPMDVKALIWEHELDELAGNDSRGVENHFDLQIRQAETVGLTRVVGGELDMAFLNPSAALAVAHRGTGSAFKTPQPVRAITVLPSRDQCLFAVRSETGFTHVEDIGRARYPLKLSLRGLDQHWLHFMLDDIFAAAGFSLADIVSWGGEIRKEGHIPNPGTARFDSLINGEVDGILDEGVHGWADAMVPAGMTVLHLREDTVARLEAIGYRRDYLLKSRYPTLPEDVLTLDFSCSCAMMPTTIWCAISAPGWRRAGK